MLPPVLLFPRKAQLFLKSQLLPASFIIHTLNFYQLNLIEFAFFSMMTLSESGSKRRSTTSAVV